MATTNIRNGAFSGCISGMLSGRQVGNFTPSFYATVVNVADAIASEVITQNTSVAGGAMADADNANVNAMGILLNSCAHAATAGIAPSSVTATDYVAIASQIVASAKQGVAKLV